jgi:hypothetical protein
MRRAGKFRDRALSFFLQGSLCLGIYPWLVLEGRTRCQLFHLFSRSHQRSAPRDFFTTQRPAGDIFPNVTNANNVKVSRLYDDVLPVLQGRTPISPRQGKRQLVAFFSSQLHAFFSS